MNLRGSGIFAQDVSSETHQYHQFHKETLKFTWTKFCPILTLIAILSARQIDQKQLSNMNYYSLTFCIIDRYLGLA